MPVEDLFWTAALLGSGRVPIRCLRTEFDTAERYLDDNRVKRLLEVFQHEGCRRCDDKHRIPLLLDKDTWKSITRAHDEADLPELLPPDGVTWAYLHGRHRLAAARCWFEPDQQWWGVDFYDQSKIPTRSKERVRDGYEHVIPYSDGTIFRQLRHLRKDTDAQKTWLGRLSPAKRRDYQQLVRQKCLEPLLQAFDALLGYEGLWNRFRVGTLHRLLTMKCTEELVTYLKGIKDTWKAIVADLPSGCYVDAHTVAYVEGRSPSLATRDQAHIHRGIDDGDAFCWVNEQGRTELKRRLCSIPHIIPSLHTFLEDSKWLEPASKILRQLVPPLRHETLRKAFHEHFDYQSSHHMMSKDEVFGNAYRDLWLFCQANFADLSDVKPRRDGHGPSNLKLRSSTETRNRLLGKAYDLGFKTPSTKPLSEAATNTDVARAIIMQARPNMYYRIRASTVDMLVETLGRGLAEISPVSPRHDVEPLTVNTIQPFNLSRRCGRIHESAYNAIQHLLDADIVYKVHSSAPREDLTAYGIARDIFFAFFGSSRYAPLAHIDEEDSVTRSQDIAHKMLSLKHIRPEYAFGGRRLAQVTQVAEVASSVGTSRLLVAPRSADTRVSKQRKTRRPISRALQPVGKTVSQPARSGLISTTDFMFTSALVQFGQDVRNDSHLQVTVDIPGQGDADTAVTDVSPREQAEGPQGTDIQHLLAAQAESSPRPDQEMACQDSPSIGDISRFDTAIEATATTIEEDVASEPHSNEAPMTAEVMGLPTAPLLEQRMLMSRRDGVAREISARQRSQSPTDARPRRDRSQKQPSRQAPVPATADLPRDRSPTSNPSAAAFAESSIGVPGPQACTPTGLGFIETPLPPVQNLAPAAEPETSTAAPFDFSASSSCSSQPASPTGPATLTLPIETPQDPTLTNLSTTALTSSPAFANGQSRNDPNVFGADTALDDIITGGDAARRALLKRAAPPRNRVMWNHNLNCKTVEFDENRPEEVLGGFWNRPLPYFTLVRIVADTHLKAYYFSAWQDFYSFIKKQKGDSFFAVEENLTDFELKNVGLHQSFKDQMSKRCRDNLHPCLVAFAAGNSNIKNRYPKGPSANYIQHPRANEELLGSQRVWNGTSRTSRRADPAEEQIRPTAQGTDVSQGKPTDTGKVQAPQNNVSVWSEANRKPASVAGSAESEL